MHRLPLEHESAARIRCSPARRKRNEDVHWALPGPSREHMMGSDSCCPADAPILGLRPFRRLHPPGWHRLEATGPIQA